MQDIKRLINKVSNQLKRQQTEPDFFYLMREISNIRKDLPDIGYALTPSQEAFRFGQMPYLNFPTNNLHSVTESHRFNEDVLILVYFFGLLGSSGPMPLYTTDFVFSRSKHSYDPTIRRFLDIINHRMLTLFYRAFAHYEIPVKYDRDPENQRLPFTSISGVREIAGNSSLKDTALAALSRFYVNSSRSEKKLEQMLSYFFKTKIKVLSFRENWHIIPLDVRLRLGDKKTSMLGENALLGSRFLSKTKDITVQIGPVSYDESMRYMPGRKNFSQLCELVKKYISKPLSLKLDLIIESRSIAKGVLNGSCALGQSVHVLSKPPAEKNKTITINVSSILSNG